MQVGYSLCVMLFARSDYETEARGASHAERASDAVLACRCSIHIQNCIKRNIFKHAEFRGLAARAARATQIDILI